MAVFLCLNLLTLLIKRCPHLLFAKRQMFQLFGEATLFHHLIINEEYEQVPFLNR